MSLSLKRLRAAAPPFVLAAVFARVGGRWVPAGRVVTWSPEGRPLRWVPAARPLQWSGIMAEVIKKEPADNLTYEMNFGRQPEVIAGATITACAVTAALLTSGGSGAVTVGAVTLASPLVRVILSGGTAGNDYTVLFTATLSTGRTRALRGTLAVRTD